MTYFELTISSEKHKKRKSVRALTDAEGSWCSWKHLDEWISGFWTLLSLWKKHFISCTHKKKPKITDIYTYISVSSGRSEKAKALIVSKRRFSDMQLKEIELQNTCLKISLPGCHLHVMLNIQYFVFFILTCALVRRFLWVFSSSCSRRKTKHMTVLEEMGWIYQVKKSEYLHVR